MKLLGKIWDNFKAQPDIWFFYGFLFTFTLSIRKVLFFYPVNEQFNEYSGIYLYLSDILLILTIFSWIILSLYNRFSILSIIKAVRVPRGTILFGFFVLWSFFSITWASNTNIALFRSLKLLELLLLFIYAATRVAPCLPVRNLFHMEQMQEGGTFFRNSAVIIIVSGLIQSILAIWQFLIQHSIGLFWLKESLIAPNMPGVAKLVFSGEKIVRAYGLFPHPNLLGGFLLLSIILSLTYKKLFHVEQCSERKCSTWNKLFGSNYINLITLITIIQIIALILTFSKSAIIGLAISLLYIYKEIIVPRLPRREKLFHVEHFFSFWGGTIINKLRNTFFHFRWHKMFHVEQKALHNSVLNVPRGTSLRKKWLLITLIIITFIYLVQPDVNSNVNKSIQERLTYINVSRGTISDNPLFGLGSGQFVISMQNYTNQKLLNWQFQPVHNVILLIWSELGLIGLFLFIWMLWKLFHVEQFGNPDVNIKCSTWNNERCDVYEPLKNVPRGTISDRLNTLTIFRGILLGFIIIMLFDHYLGDIQQGEIMLWLVLGTLAGLSNNPAIDKS